MSQDLETIKSELSRLVNELLDAAQIKPGGILALGCSSSEIGGGVIGKSPSEDIAAAVIDTVLPIVSERGVYLAVQGCEHINRSLAMESEAAELYNLEIVSVVPHIKSGGAVCSKAYRVFDKPVMVEHISADAGIDIGDVGIGMQVKHVQVPVRTSVKSIGAAHVACFRSRPRFIGGERAKYTL